MQTSDYDQVIPLAKNNKGAIISACKWGKHWQFVVETKEDSGRIGATFDSKYAILEASENYIIAESGYSFTKADLLKVNNKTMVFLTDDQRVAINTAISLLSNSNSDHADQTCYHLNQIIK